ncbi:carbohydrate ABC transporter permease [Neobacillus sp. 19]|uniref:carbohydrate ABC transporter permease n=1 Tax=Neobacillus sp. 19 TaxID=3394458 RepID=UPI003BF67BF4
MNKNKKVLIMRYIVLALAIVITIIPFIFIILTSFKDFISIMSNKVLFSPILDNYKNLFFSRGSDYPQFLQNSVIVSVVSTILSMVIGTMGAYALSWLRVPYKLDVIILTWLLVVRVIHPMALAIPFFFILNNFGLYNTKLALILIYTAMNMPFTIWMMKAFFDELPRSLGEAAEIDGCSKFQIFRMVALPLVGPGMAASVIFCFLLAWNEFLLALILTSTPDAMTFPVGISRLAQQFNVNWGEMSAAATAFSIPVFVIALVAQKYLVKGMTMGAVKG